MKAEAGTTCTLKDPTAPTDAAEAHDTDPVEVSKIKAEQRSTSPSSLGNITIKPLPAEEEEKAAKTEQHFIEIVLKDDEGNPVPDEPFEVELDDGNIISGRLGENGTARIDGIENPGGAKIRFPRIDSDEYKSA